MSVGNGWVGRQVEAHYGTSPQRAFVSGVVVAYCDAPQVLISSPDGRLMWWRADLTRRIERRESI